MSKKNITAKKITTLAMLCAVAFIAKLVSNIIPIKISGFLEFDLKDVVLVITAFLFGPLSSAVCAVITSFIEMLSISESGLIGFLMNSISSCAFSCAAGAVYTRYRTMRGAVSSLIAGTVFMTGIMLLWNYLITPLYMNVSREVVSGMLATVFLPFNLIKGGINASLTLLLYKPFVTAMSKARLIPESPTTRKKGINLGVALVSLFFLITFVILALVLAGVF